MGERCQWLLSELQRFGNNVYWDNTNDFGNGGYGGADEFFGRGGKND